MASTDILQQRALGPGDIPDLMALVEEAGWNQTVADWQRMLTLGNGIGVPDRTGRVIASAVTLPYGARIGWIGMVLVAGDWRRRGIATKLMTACVDHLEAGSLVPGLDATPAGEKVYERMGFSGSTTLSRWRRSAHPSARERTAPRVSEKELGWITRLDARAFGTSRERLIAALGESCAIFSQREAAFLFARPGRTATQLGPLCAEDENAALDLVTQACQALDGPLVIDALDRHENLSARLADLGFARERPFRRMYLGGPQYMGEPSLLFAAAGPELG